MDNFRQRVRMRIENNTFFLHICSWMTNKMLRTCEASTYHWILNQLPKMSNSAGIVQHEIMLY